MDKKNYEHRLRQAITVLVVSVIAGCYMVPEVLIVKFGIPLPLLTKVLPYVAPLLLPLIWILSVYTKFQYRPRIKIDPSDCLFLAAISFWIMSEVAQSIVYRAPHISHLVLPFFWFYTSYYALTLSLERDWLQGVFRKYLIIIPLLMCLLQFAMYLGLIAGESVSLMFLLRGDHPSGTHINIMSYIALISSWLILFQRKRSEFHNADLMLILFLFFMILVNQTRGALLLMLILLCLKAYSLTSRNLKLIFTLFLTIIFTYGIFLIVSSPANISEILDDSIRQRIGANYLALSDGVSNWLVGQGAEQGLSVRYEGALPHSFNIRVFHAYGILGLLFFNFVLLSLFYKSRHDFNVINFSGFTLLHGIMFFEAYLYLWYALIPIAARVMSDELVSFRRKTSNV
jgi:hypothetical protein